MPTELETWLQAARLMMRVRGLQGERPFDAGRPQPSTVHVTLPVDQSVAFEQELRQLVEEFPQANVETIRGRALLEKSEAGTSREIVEYLIALLPLLAPAVLHKTIKALNELPDDWRKLKERVFRWGRSYPGSVEVTEELIFTAVVEELDQRFGAGSWRLDPDRFEIGSPGGIPGHTDGRRILRAFEEVRARWFWFAYLDGELKEVDPSALGLGADGPPAGSADS